jgi:hypothetical protein
MTLTQCCKKILLLVAATVISYSSFANEELFKEARALQKEGQSSEAIEAFKRYLLQPVMGDLTVERIVRYTDALV